MSTPAIEAAREWLAQADTSADHAYRWWQSPEAVAIIPLGTAFDAVKIVPPLTEQLLANPLVDGPVIRYGETGAAYILVPAGTMDTWRTPYAQCLGELYYLNIPDPTRCTPPGTYWSRPPDGTGHLTDPTQLAQVIAEAVEQQAAEVKA